MTLPKEKAEVSWQLDLSNLMYIPIQFVALNRQIKAKQELCTVKQELGF